MEMKSPRVDLVIDRDKAAAVGLNADADRERALRRLRSAVVVDDLRRRARSTACCSSSIRSIRSSADSLEQLVVQDADAARSCRSNRSCSFKEDVGPQTRQPLGPAAGRRRSRSACGPACRSAPPSITINEVARQVLPPTVTTSFQGSAKVFQAVADATSACCSSSRSASSTSCSGMLYESYIHPLTILSGLPSAGLGALVTLWLFGNELNIYSFVGLIMLIGIVKKNAIMQIDFALEAERQHGKTPAEAIYEGCLIRFRPIMMTTMAALLGALPIALGLRRRRRGAAAARPGGRRRPARLAAHHALPDAGRLHLHGEPGQNQP